MKMPRLPIIGLILLIVIAVVLVVFISVFSKKSIEIASAQENSSVGDIVRDAEHLLEMQRTIQKSESGTAQSETVLVAPEALAKQHGAKVAKIREEAIARREGILPVNSNSDTIADSLKNVADSSKVASAELSETEDGSAETDWGKRVSDEKNKWDDFVNELSSWANPTRNANEARIRANDIRKSAKDARKEAGKIKSRDDGAKELKAVMNNRADLMDEVANNLSSTRGNNMKMREFKNGLAGYKNAIPRK